MMQYKNQLIVALIIFIFSLPLLYGLWIISSQSKPKTTYDMKILPTDHIFGNTKSRNILIEYSDFQCPACAYYSKIIKQLRIKYSSSAAIVYRHFPLAYHPNSTKAAQAAEAAAKQGKFWEMNDLLFDKQKEWETSIKADEIFQKYAQSLKLNIEDFKKDYATEETSKKIQNDFISGTSYSVNATPTFFLNGKKLENIQTLEDFEREMNKS